MIYGINYFDMPNVGDANCSPLQYLLNGQMLKINSDLSHLKSDDVLIVGGGAVISPMRKYSTKAVKIAWGVGNTNRNTKTVWHNPNGFALYGCRDDVGVGDYVPCVSCLSPLFDKYREQNPEHDAVVYGHKLVSPLKGEHYLDNSCMDFERVIKFLASGEKIITSSYHGMYWGLLLGRKVSVKPFGAKFYHLRWKAGFDGEFNDAPEALAEARALNQAFAEKVLAYV